MHIVYLLAIILAYFFLLKNTTWRDGKKPFLSSLEAKSLFFHKNSYAVKKDQIESLSASRKTQSLLYIYILINTYIHAHIHTHTLLSACIFQAFELAIYLVSLLFLLEERLLINPCHLSLSFYLYSEGKGISHDERHRMDNLTAPNVSSGRHLKQWSNPGIPTLESDASLHRSKIYNVSSKEK